MVKSVTKKSESANTVGDDCNNNNHLYSAYTTLLALF